jgi:hypothetical protein
MRFDPEEWKSRCTLLLEMPLWGPKPGGAAVSLSQYRNGPSIPRTLEGTAIQFVVWVETVIAGQSVAVQRAAVVSFAGGFLGFAIIWVRSSVQCDRRPQVCSGSRQYKRETTCSRAGRVGN